jgi:hypothetical protein
MVSSPLIGTTQWEDAAWDCSEPVADPILLGISGGSGPMVQSGRFLKPVAREKKNEACKRVNLFHIGDGGFGGMGVLLHPLYDFSVRPKPEAASSMAERL